MNHLPFFSLILLSLATMIHSCEEAHPPSSETQLPSRTWYKGNLHTHSYWSDGDEFPERIMAWYKSRGYHFLALSDHNRLAEGEFWKEIPEGDMYQEAFQAYRDTFGDEWVSYRQVEGKTEVKLKTYAEYKPLFEEEGVFHIIQSEEITDQFEGKPLHLNATNIQALIEPQGGSSVLDVLQNNIDAVIQQRAQTGESVIVHVNHPNFGYAVSVHDMIALKGERFFEVYNGHPAVHNLGDSIHIGTEEMWDLINIAYLQAGKPLMYGLATDDSHHYHEFDSKWSNSGRGWVRVAADSLETDALIAAMESGDFYASTGVELLDLVVEDNRLSLVVDAEAGVQYEIAFIGCKTGESQTKVLQQSTGTEAHFQLEKDHLFVRARILSDKDHPNPVEHILKEQAWTQPVMWTSE